MSIRMAILDSRCRVSDHGLQISLTAGPAPKLSGLAFGFNHPQKPVHRDSRVCDCMKKFLAFSILLNLVLLGGMICFLSNRQKAKAVSLPILPPVQPPGSVMATSAASPPTGT